MPEMYCRGQGRARRELDGLGGGSQAEWSTRFEAGESSDHLEAPAESTRSRRSEVGGNSMTNALLR
jgi:hypothetical protein